MSHSRADGPAVRRLLGVRLACFYAAVFGVVGVHLPYWPVWLQAERGLAPEAVGVLLAAMYWPRVVTSIGIARFADRQGERRRPMVALAALALVAVALFWLAEGFWPLLLLSLIAGATFAGLLPLGEAVALREAAAAGLDYGRLRLFGSLAFILTASGGGLLIERGGPWLILPLLVALQVLTLLACLALPERRLPEPKTADRGMPALARPGILVVALAAGLIGASHAVYYGFSTIHWRAAGISESTIGWLWAEGVVAEVLLFAVAGPLFLRLPARRLLALGGALASLRWAGTAWTVDLPVLVVLQALHAASFGLAHLAIMHHLRSALPAAALATGQGLLASLSALLFGLVTPLAGWLYGAHGSAAFLVMGMLALLGSGLALLPVGRRDPGP